MLCLDQARIWLINEPATMLPNPFKKSTELFFMNVWRSIDTGSRPGSRATFVSAKVAKTIAAPSGLMGGEGRQPCEERTNSLCSDKVREMLRASLPGASRQASELRSVW
ncbi:hypothetical protein [Candidatus Nitrospira neomarina]|uniref:Uncharacterized protein n=1 Tax=Candidatus Nitrospira neomarina TaxID=3020899 RepID=A0AA96GMF4_9BACT|nr:hypothetical protein [Candidatus Nitrospira neomarina]WNM63542.1 hypothetical protein PQG83_07245 [Candidatus Nitrospira neomarina]